MDEAITTCHRTVWPGPFPDRPQELLSPGQGGTPVIHGSASCASPAATAAAENSTPATLAASNTCCSSALSQSSCMSIICRRLSGTLRSTSTPRSATRVLLQEHPLGQPGRHERDHEERIALGALVHQTRQPVDPRQAWQATGEIGGNGVLGQQRQRQFHAVPVQLQFLLDAVQGMRTA